MSNALPAIVTPHGTDVAHGSARYGTDATDATENRADRTDGAEQDTARDTALTTTEKAALWDLLVRSVSRLRYTHGMDLSMRISLFNPERAEAVRVADGLGILNFPRSYIPWEDRESILRAALGVPATADAARRGAA